MTRINWTEGRVVRDTHSGIGCDIRHERGRRMALCWGIGGNDNHREEYRADCDAIARRFIAAWNACEGVPIEVLEAEASGGMPWSVAEQIDLAVLREDLVAALKLARWVIEDAGRPVPRAVIHALSVDEQRRAALADVARNRAKNDGTLRRQEDERALAIQIKEGGIA